MRRIPICNKGGSFVRPAVSIAPRDPAAPRSQRIGLVLGAGAARGWAHIGVLRRLEELGLRPDIVVGCSSGALVGASYAVGKLDALEDFAARLTWRGMLGFLDISWRGGGLIEGRWLVDFFRRHFDDVRIEDIGMPYAAVATELDAGRETWLTKGPIIDAVRASIALPGLITPIRLGDRWMVDGALVNPLPVSLCRAMGADVILGVSTHGDLVSSAPPPAAAAPVGATSSWLSWIGGGASAAETDGAAGRGSGVDGAAMTDRLGYLDVMGRSLFVVQNFVSRVRLAADPVDVLISPKVEQIGLMDFHRGSEAIAAGRAAVDAEIAAIRRVAQSAADAPGDADPRRSETT